MCNLFNLLHYSGCPYAEYADAQNNGVKHKNKKNLTLSIMTFSSYAECH